MRAHSDTIKFSDISPQTCVMLGWIAKDQGKPSPDSGLLSGQCHNNPVTIQIVGQVAQAIFT